MDLGFLSTAIIAIVGLYLLYRFMNNGAVSASLKNVEVLAKTANKATARSLSKFDAESKLQKAKHDKKMLAKFKKLGETNEQDRKDLADLLAGIK